MMAKFFYTMEEAQQALGQDEEGVKQFVREGKLREFRDANKLFFKAEQIDQLRQELGIAGGGEDVDLGPSDTGGPIGLADSSSGTGMGASGTGMGLSDSGPGGSVSGTGSGSMISLTDTGAGSGSIGDGTGAGGSMGGSGMVMKDDTALEMDALANSGSASGLSGSFTGTTSPGGSASGVNVLGPDDSFADPSAQTAINASIQDQVNLEGPGSGSGLLDLTSEGDDTSLGAVTLEEIDSSGAPAATAAAPAIPQDRNAPRRAAGTTAGRPVYVEAVDPLAPAFGGLALGAAVFALLGILGAIMMVMRVQLGVLDPIAKTARGESAFTMLAAIGLGVAILFGVLGLVIGKVAK
ncbi:MAG: hypothetical protein ACFCVE_05090 [Phycisphaerae bacterium]